jgi:hypothetical protein
MTLETARKRRWDKKECGWVGLEEKECSRRVLEHKTNGMMMGGGEGP